ncbi:hypothetical protein E0Z10_g4878 [Xylaria hypoxylon]|uniref:Receptor L-domain domain-containing protein n=1 Tax=Xylaria hypoxylon TaxID=37992 RepID=A0A4Z0YK27_9PEZI|nr:hypothetical protein E0Z10_g4878 [Xylaria hypoxylon]
MDPYSCPYGFNISSQLDIDASTTDFQQCRSNDAFINIISPTTDLVFPPGLRVNNISATGLHRSLNLNLNATDIVDNLYIQEFYDGSLVLPIQVDLHNGTIRSIALTNSEPSYATYDRVNVYGNGTSEWKQVNGRRVIFYDITYLSVLQLQDTGLSSSTLKSIGDLEIDGGVLEASELTFIRNNATLTNFVVPVLSSQPLDVGGDLTVRHKVNVEDDEPSAGELADFSWLVHSVDGNFDVEDWSNSTLRLPELTAVGKQLSVHDSINSTFVFSALTSVGNLTMQNNGGSLLPGDFRNLEWADSIQLRGNMDTSSFGNIFPSLKLVKQSITIEASNTDFNCSRLAFQQSQGLIGQLSCNGLDVDDARADPPSVATRSGVSQGVLVSIGIAIAIAVLVNP